MDLLGAPGEEDVDWLVVEPTHKVGQQAQRGVVGPVQVIEKEDTRRRTVEHLEQDPHDFPEEATPGTRSSRAASPSARTGCGSSARCTSVSTAFDATPATPSACSRR